MARKKETTTIPLPDDIGHSFEDEDAILNYRPVIEYVEPEQEAWVPPEEEKVLTIDEARDKTQDLINGFNAVVKLADIAQKRIDERVKAAGGVNIKLDPVKDAHTLAAMKRRFPDKDPNTITYDDYKQVVDCVKQQGIEPPSISADDIRAAKSDPYRTDFGGYGNQQGENRAEISSPTNAIKPVDLQAFQAAGVIALFKLMLPLIQQQDTGAITQHKIDTPHS